MSTFWGLRLEPGKRYSTTVDKTFRVTMAALDTNSVKNDKDIHCVMLEEGESNIPFILCNLQKPTLLQSRLDLNFESGDRITFFCRGTGTVHLTGYILAEEDDFAQFGEDEEVEEEEEVDDELEDDDDDEKETTDKVSKLNGMAGKRKGAAVAGLSAKKLKGDVAEQESGDESDEDDEDDDDIEDDLADSDEEGESEDGSEAEMEVEKPSPAPSNKKKQKNKQGQQQSPGQQQGKQKQQNTALNGSPQSAAGQQQKKKQPQQPGNEKPTGKKHLEGGVAVQELKVGNGQICKPGKMATVYYTGRLKSNNKVFDQTTQGAGFKFRVGRGEVIKGWDVGLSGMKVGGKRLITCPPNMAYGQKGMPPTIPGNSSLVFEVELRGVN